MKKVLVASVIAVLGMGAGAEAHLLSAPAIVAIKAAPDFSQKVACGSRGGPGYRKANGKCASWRR